MHRNLNLSAFWRHWQALIRNNSSIANALKFTFHAYALTWQILLQTLFALKFKTPPYNLIEPKIISLLRRRSLKFEVLFSKLQKYIMYSEIDGIQDRCFWNKFRSNDFNAWQAILKTTNGPESHFLTSGNLTF